LKWYDEEGENHIKKRFLKLKYFSPLIILTSPLFEETLGAFLFLPLFPFFFFFFVSFFNTFFYAPPLEDLGVLMIFEEKKHFFKNFLFKWLDMEWHGHECGYTSGGCIFLNGVMHTNIAKPSLWRCGSCGYIVVDAYSGVEVCTPIFLGEASK
jgi:hypothetical protein